MRILGERLRVSTRLALTSILLTPTSLLVRTLGPRSSPFIMATTEKVDLDALAASDPKKAEQIYKNILQGLQTGVTVFGHLMTAPTESKSETEHDQEARLKEQESALVKLAELYRDQKSVSPTLIMSFAVF